MTLNELLLEQRVESLREINPAAAIHRAEAEKSRRHGARHAIAAALMRIGAWIDPESRAQRPTAMRQTWY